jgi:mitochondrial fission protein ELM1
MLRFPDDIKLRGTNYKWFSQTQPVINLFMNLNQQNPQCWVVTEGMAGTENQCLGVAEALGLEPIVHRISLRQPWKALSPYLGCETASTFTSALLPPWPDLLIASGRKSVAASRYIKRKSAGKTFTVQIQDPRVHPSQFDLVGVPQHDLLRSENVLVTVAAPNRVTPEKLLKARNDFAHLFAMMPSPHIAIVLGGNSKTHTISFSEMEKLGTQLAALKGSLIITASRRTTEDQIAAFRKGLGDYPHYLWDGTGENPYLGMLAWADYIMVTADSVSMIGDALTTGKPVYMIPMEGRSDKFDRFHQNLLENGYIRRFEGTMEKWSYMPLRDAASIAEEIRKRMGF